jgi:purine-binding chemotaxis protein CheW
MVVVVNLRAPPPVDSVHLAVLVFTLAGRRFGVPADMVERVEPACEITPLPDAPAVVRGIVSVRGTLTPVLDLRPRFGDAVATLTLDQRFVLTRTASRAVAIIADAIEDIRQIPRDAVTRLAQLFPGAGRLNGLAAVPDGLIYLHDPEGWMSEADEARLDTALARGVAQ